MLNEFCQGWSSFFSFSSSFSLGGHKKLEIRLDVTDNPAKATYEYNSHQLYSLRCEDCRIGCMYHSWKMKASMIVVEWPQHDHRAVQLNLVKTLSQLLVMILVRVWLCSFGGLACEGPMVAWPVENLVSLAYSRFSCQPPSPHCSFSALAGPQHHHNMCCREHQLALQRYYKNPHTRPRWSRITGNIEGSCLSFVPTPPHPPELKGIPLSGNVLVIARKNRS